MPSSRTTLPTRKFLSYNHLDGRIDGPPTRFARFVHFFARLNSIIATLCVPLLAACSPTPDQGADRWALPDLDRLAVTAVVDTMDADQLAGQLLMIGVEVDGASVEALTPELEALLVEVQPGGVVLFAGSFVSAEQIAALVATIHDSLSVPALISTDHEGGLVARLDSDLGATPIPPARSFETVEDLGAARRIAQDLGRVAGAELRAVGVTMNLAPVADVDPADARGAIGRHGRTYSRDPGRAGDLAGEVARGLQDAGVLATLKHFPGHGGVLEDSHYEVAILAASVDEWRNRDLVAFAAAASSGPAAIMTAHLAVPAITGTDLPATIAPPIVAFARDIGGDDALLITDALNMAAIRARGPEPEIAVDALRAGHDILLKPTNPMSAREAVSEAMRTGQLPADGVRTSVERMLRWKAEAGLIGPAWAVDELVLRPDPERIRATLGSEEHRRLVAPLTETEDG